MELPNIYKGDYLKLAALPVLLALISIFFIFQVQPGLEFKGGAQITLEMKNAMTEAQVKTAVVNAGFSDASIRTYDLGGSHITEIEIANSDDVVKLESVYKDFLDTYDKYSKKQYEILVLKGSNASTTVQENDAAQMRQHLLDLRVQIIQYASAIEGRPVVLSTDVDALKPEVQSLFMGATFAYRDKIISKISHEIPYNSFSFKLVNPSLSEVFVGKIWGVVLAAAVLCALAVLIMFRDFIPSVAVLAGATFDVIFALGFMGLMGIPLTLAAVASLLMLVGFSLDTDILLTVRILKRGLRDPRNSAYEAMKTGATMSFTAMLAFGALFAVGQLTNIAIYQDISSIVLAGLVGDLIGTWMLNAVMMIHHVEKGVNRAGIVVR